jgi:hypothetical protein
MGTLIELLRGEYIGVHNAAVGLGLLMHLRLTYRSWRPEVREAQPHALRRRFGDWERIDASEFKETTDPRRSAT